MTMDATSARLTAQDLSLIGAASESAQVWGMPVRQTTEGRYTVLWYGSPVQAYADHIYVANGRIAVISRSDMRAPKPLAPFVAAYGAPEVSYRLPAAGTHDSFNITVHTWPTKGKLAVTADAYAGGGVIREEAFQPAADIASFTASGSAGDRFAGYRTATVDAASMRIGAGAPRPGAWGIGAGVVAIVLLAVAASAAIRVRRGR